MGVNRDRYLDFFKGLLILWVIQIHTVFWSGTEYIPDMYRQLSLLIDVSGFVFISGYLTKVSDFGSSFQKSLKQFKILYLEYLVLSCLLIFPLWLFYFFKEKSNPDLLLAIISMLRVNPVGDLWEDLAVYPGSLWYMAVYFSLLPFIPFVLSLFGSRKLRIVILTAVLVLFVICGDLDWNYPFLFTETIYFLFYLFIFLLGTSYKLDEERIPLRYLKLSLLTTVTVCLLLFFFIKGGTLNLQINKFPPNIIYLPYSLLVIHLFTIFRQMFKSAPISHPNQALQFLEWCGKNSYSIYLMQGIVCSIPGYLIPFVLNNGVPGFVVYVITLLFNLSFTLLLAFLWNRSKIVFAELVTTLNTRNATH